MKVEKYRQADDAALKIPGLVPAADAILRAHPEEAWQFTFYYVEVSQNDVPWFARLDRSRSPVPARLVGDKLTLFADGREEYRLVPHAHGMEAWPLDAKAGVRLFKSTGTEKVLLEKASEEVLEKMKRRVLEFFRSP